MTHIPEDVKKEILDKATVENVLIHYHNGLGKKKGADYHLYCPKCETDDKLSYNRPKSVAKCFKCDIGVKTPANYLMKFHGLTYGQALHELARIECIEIPERRRRPKSKAKAKEQYLDQLLAGSGLVKEDITSQVYVDDSTTREIPVYESGTVDSKFEVVPGDDVIIRYYDLEGKPMQYYRTDKKGNPVGKKLDFYRVRFQNPDLHLDRKGNPCKYKSPWGSDSKIYINKWIREKYKKSSKIKTLYIQEGEKKADKATKHGLISVGVMGIHNVASKKKLPKEFELIIKRCQVEQVVFVLDSDWKDLSNKIDSKRSADQRPKSFFRAVLNFRDHFYAFHNVDIHLKIFFAHVKENNEKDKGIDDLLTNSLRGKEDELRDLCDKALLDPNGDAKWLQFYNITTMSEFKLKSFWYLENKDAFANHYKERLKSLPKFQFGKVEWRFNEQGILELAQPLMDNEQFWTENIKRNAEGEVSFKKFTFNHKRCYRFLSNRGFFKLKRAGGGFIWVHIDKNVVREVEPYEIKEYVMEWTEQINMEEVENMLFRGGKMYLGPDSLGNIPYTTLQLNEPSENIQYLYFKDAYFRITEEGYELHELKDLTGQVWKDNIIDFSPSKTDILITEIHQVCDNDVKENPELKPFIGEYTIDFSEDGHDCHWLQFLLNTSTFVDKNTPLSEAPLEDRFETTRHLLSKLTAFGYMLHRYRDASRERAVIGMDGKMSHVGASNGRSGKSLFGVALGQLVPAVTIPGKKKDLLDDRFLFEEVDQRTAIIFFDDVRVNFDFEFLFPYITGKFTLERKGFGKVTLPSEYVQKFYIATNHALNGNGDSFEDRQFLLAYSDWYNGSYKPTDDFKIKFFHDWGHRQWNLFYNFAAMCLHLYFKYGLIDAPTEKLKNRRLRQQMGENFMDWAEEYFSNINNVNTRVIKDTMYQATRSDGSEYVEHGDGFVTKYPGERRFNSIQKFKQKLKMYCQYKSYDYNPSTQGGDIKTSGKEYIEIFIPEDDYKQMQNDAIDDNPFAPKTEEEVVS